MEEEPRQLKINGAETKVSKEKKEEKEKHEKGNNWIVVLILAISVIASVIFRLVNPRGGEEKTKMVQPEEKTNFQLFKPVEYKFTK